MLGMGVWLTTELLEDWLTHPSYTEISSEFTNEYYLPAITICNINLMNRTKMEADKVEMVGKRGFNTTVSVYKLFQALQDKHQVHSYFGMISEHRLKVRKPKQDLKLNDTKITIITL